MKNSLLLYLKSIILAFAMIILANVAVAQTTLYSTDFGTSNAFPAGWTASGGTTYGLIILPALHRAIQAHRAAIMPITAQAERRY